MILRIKSQAKGYEQLTLDFRLYLNLKLTYGTKANVKTIPKIMPPMRPAKFCCHGNVLIPKRQAAISNNLMSAKYGFFNCFQWQNVKMIASDEITPASDDRGPTLKIKEEYYKNQ